MQRGAHHSELGRFLGELVSGGGTHMVVPIVVGTSMIYACVRGRALGVGGCRDHGVIQHVSVED